MRALEEAREDSERRMDARFALFCSVLANVHRDPKERRTPYKFEDFMPRPRPRTREELLAKLRQFSGSLQS